MQCTFHKNGSISYIGDGKARSGFTSLVSCPPKNTHCILPSFFGECGLLLPILLSLRSNLYPYLPGPLGGVSQPEDWLYRNPIKACASRRSRCTSFSLVNDHQTSVFESPGCSYRIKYAIIQHTNTSSGTTAMSFA